MIGIPGARAILAPQIPGVPTPDPDAVAADSIRLALEQIGESVTETGQIILQGRQSHAR
jgi:hypothetical protein